jgi:ATP-binding cassette subfamily B (MDR/TAP) protein 1
MREEGVDGERTFISIFVIMFSTFGAGHAQQYGPSTGKALKAALRIFSIIDEKSDVDIDEDRSDEVIATPEIFEGKVEFRNVWFRYPTRPDIWILRDFSLTINPKEHVALVGESGSGKSTIVQLLYRFYEPHFGQILIDGVDIRHYNLKSLRRQFGLVQQMPTLFNESVLYNICYGEETLDEEGAIQSAEVANANGFIAKMADLVNQEQKKEIQEKDEETNVDIEDVKRGLYVNCGTSGGRLSGGQKQRIVIARAVIRKPKVLLLDEATSALDEVSQGKVQEALEQVMKGRTSIVIAHRLTTIENADRIIILREGKIYREGKFNDLRDDL